MTGGDILNITGIVVEYNPFHNGHEYHVKKSTENTNCDGIVAVMSGNFVQRGIPAMIDKWNRTEMALQGGVDLVIELPVIYSISSAEFFAFGAVSLLNNIGVIQNISFGCETADSASLYNIADVLNREPEDYKILLKNHLNLGNSFPKARTLALQNYFNLSFERHDISDILSSSNNILAIEYYKNLLKINSTITCIPIKRIGSNYNDTKLGNTFASATAIREFIKSNKNLNELKHYIPDITYKTLLELQDEKYPFVYGSEMYKFIKYRYYAGDRTLNNLPEASEGLDNRIYKSIEKSNNYDELMDLAKTKRYTYTRISRLLCQYFLHFDRLNYVQLRKLQCPYARILGFNSKGREIIKLMKKHSNIPIITKMPYDLCETLKADIFATRAYSMLNNQIKSNSDYLNNPIIINN